MRFFHKLDWRSVLKKVRPSKGPSSIAPFILAFLVIVGFAFLARTALLRHWSIGTYHFDLGNMYQAVYTTSIGRFLEVTDPFTFEQTSRLAFHFDPIMAAIAPLLWIYEGAETLLVVQALVVALGAIPVFFIAQRILKNDWYGISFAILYLLYFPVHMTTTFDFHAVTLSTSFLLWMFYFGEVKRFKLSAVFMILAWVCKENLPLVTGMFGLYHFFIRKNRRFGLLTAIASGLVFTVVMLWVIPMSRTISEGAHFAQKYYTTDVATNLERLFRPQSATYIQSLLTPVGFLSLFAPFQLLISLPEWLIILLSRSDNMRLLIYHYTAVLTPFIIISSIYGIRNVTLISNRFIKDSHQKKIVAPVLSEIILVMTLITMFIYSPVVNANYTVKDEQLTVIREWQKKLDDPKITVSTSGHLSPYFADRIYFYNFLYDFAYRNYGTTDQDIEALADHYTKAEYVLIRPIEVSSGGMPTYYYDHLRGNEEYEMIFNESGIEIYQKTSK